MKFIQSRNISKKFFTSFVLVCFYLCCSASQVNVYTDTSKFNDAVNYINSISSLTKSVYWPGINPEAFLKNIKDGILNPLSVYQGSNTNFCGYAALTYLPMHDDPLGHAQKLVELYENGEVQYGRVFLKPSAAVRKAAGKLIFKGALDIRPAEQLWFLTLADHFKGYINFFNRKYDPGDENTFWAAVNYAKFNRMIRQLFDYDVKARGTDLRHPRVGDMYTYLQKKLDQRGTTFVFQNNAYLRKRGKGKLKPGYPTHFVVLLSIEKHEDGLLSLKYWDYGFRSLRQVTPDVLKKIVFGISHVSKKTG